MGDILARLKPDELKACQLAVKLIEDKILELGVLKRGHKHLCNELMMRHGVAGRIIEMDYETGLIMERPQEKEEQETEVQDG